MNLLEIFKRIHELIFKEIAKVISEGHAEDNVEVVP